MPVIYRVVAILSEPRRGFLVDKWPKQPGQFLVSDGGAGGIPHRAELVMKTLGGALFSHANLRPAEG